MAGMDAAIIAEAIVHLAIGMHAAEAMPRSTGTPIWPVSIALGIAAIGGGDFAAEASPSVGAFALGHEIDQPAHLARAIDRRRRPAQNFDLGGIAQRRGVSAAIFRPLEASK